MGYRNSDDYYDYQYDSDDCGCKRIVKEAKPCKDYPCKRDFPKCLKVCVKPGCYECKELKKYECKYTEPKYEYRYTRKVCKKPVISCPKTSCSCLAVRYNKN